MHKRKPTYLLILIISGLMLLSLQCDFLSLSTLDSPIPAPETQATEEEAVGVSEPEDNGRFGGLLKIVSDRPLLLILPLLFIAALLLLVIRLRPRHEREPTLRPQGTTPLAEAELEEETLEIKQAPHLTLVADTDMRFSLPLEQDVLTIGRASDNDLVIDEHFPGYETVSRTHARLYQRAGHWIIEDMNSKNGVYVNQQRTGCNLLQEGWNVSIGGVTFRFHIHKAEVAA